MIKRQHIDLNLDHAASLFTVCLRILVTHLHPEARAVIAIEFELLISTILGQHGVIVRLIQLQRLLDECAVFDELLEVDLRLTDDVVRLEEVTIIHLDSEFVVFARNFDSVDETVLEVRFAVLVAVVSVSLLHVFF